MEWAAGSSGPASDMSRIVDDHRAYLSDPVRVDAFARAIAATVRPGDVVVDLGSGTGILGLFACRAGARRVYALETNGMIEVGRALARANGFADRFIFIQRHSTDAVLPEPADALVADMAGGMGFEAGIFGTYLDARRFMKPHGRMIPQSITMAAAPVEEAGLSHQVHFWDAPVANFDMTPVLTWAANTGYPRLLPPESLLADDSVQATYEPTVEHSMLRLKGDVTVVRAGVLHGIGGWFDAELAPGVRLTNAPRATVRLNRRNVFFPL
ncbi:MAG TPA: 50S ribosomal protein L11 methyltransferase, partial [Thermomicrobiales bacterium]|nr:50S ribosomal protein L11 methyltransferase [Thermomicrobiales bacterium]